MEKEKEKVKQKASKPPSPMRVKRLIKKLREASAGTCVWRVQDKDRRSYCIEFNDWEKWEAEKWWEENRTKWPDYHKNNELKRVHFHTAADRAMIEAANMLERLL